MSPFTLHPQLAHDTFPLADLPLCRLLLMNNRHFPWVILVPRRENLRELFDLAPDDYRQLMLEARQVSQQLREHTNAYKMNIAALGNIVPQLHVHIIARFEQDAAWPHPVWNCGVQPEPYPAAEKARITFELQVLLMG